MFCKKIFGLIGQVRRVHLCCHLRERLRRAGMTLPGAESEVGSSTPPRV
jgi:hypothetical protein